MCWLVDQKIRLRALQSPLLAAVKRLKVLTGELRSFERICQSSRSDFWTSRCSFISSVSSMDSIHWQPGEKLDPVEFRRNWKQKKHQGDGRTLPVKNSRFLDENWTTLLLKRLKERMRWEDVEEEEHLYEEQDKEKMLHPDVRIYFAYLERYCWNKVYWHKYFSSLSGRGGSTEQCSVSIQADFLI